MKRARGAVLLALLALPVCSCELVVPRPDLVAPAEPTPGPEARCADACVSRARACSAAQCASGCRFVLDRLVEHEGAHVLACVASAKTKRCDDATFAECAARAGPYLDGGPTPPKAPSDDDDS